MKTIKRVLLIGAPTLFLLFSCQNETSTSEPTASESIKLSEQFERKKLDLASEFSKIENPIKAIAKEITLNSNVASKANGTAINEVDIMKAEIKINFERMKSRLELVQQDRLSSEEFFADVNGAFEKDATFKTELGRKVSEYYAEKFNNARRQNLIKSDAFQTFKEAQEIQKKLNEND